MEELRETEFKDLYAERTTDDFIQFVKDLKSFLVTIEPSK